MGRRFSWQICSALRIFFTVIGFSDPPRTVGSLARITHSVPLIWPMPVTTAAPVANSVPAAAVGESSRNGLSASTSSSMRSRTSSRPLAWCRATYCSPPPATASAIISSSEATCASIAARLASYVGEVTSRLDRRMLMSLLVDGAAASRRWAGGEGCQP